MSHQTAVRFNRMYKKQFFIGTFLFSQRNKPDHFWPSNTNWIATIIVSKEKLLIEVINKVHTYLVIIYLEKKLKILIVYQYKNII